MGQIGMDQKSRSGRMSRFKTLQRAQILQKATIQESTRALTVSAHITNDKAYAMRTNF
jgi:hypothetical protein